MHIDAVIAGVAVVVRVAVRARGVAAVAVRVAALSCRHGGLAAVDVLVAHIGAHVVDRVIKHVHTVYGQREVAGIESGDM